MNYPNLLTPQLTAYAQQISSVQPQGPIRTASGVISSSQANLAALQQAASVQAGHVNSQQGSAAGPVQGGNASSGGRPVMVTVDPSRHSGMQPAHAQHPPQNLNDQPKGMFTR